MDYFAIGKWLKPNSGCVSINAEQVTIDILMNNKVVGVIRKVYLITFLTVLDLNSKVGVLCRRLVTIDYKGISFRVIL